MSKEKDDIEAAEETAGGESAQPGPDEVFCMVCGSVIKERAEVCPDCGVRQTEEEPAGGPDPTAADQGQRGGGANLTERRQYELEKIAGEDKMTVVLVGFLLSPVAYWMVGKKALAIANFLTFNFFLLGILIVPIHCYSMITDAEEELRRAGVGGY